MIHKVGEVILVLCVDFANDNLRVSEWISLYTVRRRWPELKLPHGTSDCPDAQEEPLPSTEKDTSARGHDLPDPEQGCPGTGLESLNPIPVALPQVHKAHVWGESTLGTPGNLGVQAAGYILTER